MADTLGLESTAEPSLSQVYVLIKRCPQHHFERTVVVMVAQGRKASRIFMFVFLKVFQIIIIIVHLGACGCACHHTHGEVGGLGN